ncbi:pyridoxamine 5-phosphate oxidase [Saccharibacillus sp. O16]|nr:pyridoxamine 5-phosphate oxidase [Saccharibacillus sp. O16]
MIRYPLASTSWDEKELAAIQKVVDSGIFTMGKEVAEFERQFADYVGSRYCVMVNSGSSANLIATAALFYTKKNALQKGDEVIVPAVSWPTTYYPLYQYGLKMKFVDIDPHTLNYDLNALRDAVTENTKMIMCVNLLGNPNDFGAIREIASEHNIILIEDNCESLGATYDNKQAGTFGVMGTYSSFFSHHISTMEGGMVVTDDEELYHVLLSLRAHGWTRNLPKFNQVCGEKSDDAFEESFRFVLPGYNVRPVEMSGAIGQEQIKKLPSFVEERRKNAELFQKLFGGHRYFDIQKEISSSSWFGFALIIKEEAPFDRGQVVKLLEQNGIDTRPIVAGNFTKNEVVQWFDHEISGDLKNANHIDRNGFFIGNHHFDISEQLHAIYKLLDGME